MLNLSKQIAKPLQCPDCDIDMHFLVSKPMTRVFVSTILVRRFFLCQNCGRLSHQLVSMPEDSSSSPRPGSADSSLPDQNVSSQTMD